MKGKIFFSGLALAVIFVLLAGLSLPINAEVVNQGGTVPDFSLVDMEGNTHNLYEYEGYVIFFNIFGVT